MPAPAFPLPAEYGTEILRSEVGSTLHGTGLPGQEDRDEMGVYVEPMRAVIDGSAPGHWSFRTAGEGNRSTAIDTDVISYSLRKFCRLAAHGNPSVLLPLYAPASALVLAKNDGHLLRSNAAWFASKRAGAAFLGYMERQRQRMTGRRGAAGRIRTMPDGQVDWKYAMHMLRLGYQGEELLKTGRITLPVPEAFGEYLRSVRRGEESLADVLGMAAMLEDRVKIQLGYGPLPDEPAWDQISRFMEAVHAFHWMGVGPPL